MNFGLFFANAGSFAQTDTFDADLDTIRRYQDIGVSRLVTTPPGFDPDGIARGLEAFGNDVLAKL